MDVCNYYPYNHDVKNQKSLTIELSLETIPQLLKYCPILLHTPPFTFTTVCTHVRTYVRSHYIRTYVCTQVGVSGG